MKTISAILLGATLAATAPAIAEDYRDVDSNFHVTVPDAWKTMKVDNELFKLFLLSPRVKETHGACVVVAQAHAEMAGMTQAEIDAKLNAAITDKFWEMAMMMSPGIENPQLKSSGTETRRGRQVYNAVMSFTVNVKLPDHEPIIVPSMGKQILIAIPGQFFIVGCTSREESYAVEESDFNSVLDSFEPLSDALTVSNETPGVPSLTLYSLARFGGVSHVVTRDTPDLATSGWRGATASASTGGTPSWEICDRPNYAGNCRVVSGVLPSGLGAGGTPIASARRVARGAAPATLARAAQSDIAAALTGLVEGGHGE